MAPADDETLASYLPRWLVLQRTRLEPSSWESYYWQVHGYLLPHLGDREVRELTVPLLERFYVDLLTDGGRYGQPLAKRTVAYAHMVLHKALADGVRAGELSDNPAARARLPRVDLRSDATEDPPRMWNAGEVRRFLELTKDDELGDLWAVALGTGMRRGELLALRWSDVDLDVPSLQVAAGLTWIGDRPRLKTTKTRNRRRLHLDDRTAAAIARQPRREPNPHPVVFTQEDGSPWHTQTISDRWRRQWPGLDLPQVRLHDLRHIHATLLIAAGVNMKVVSERLGHKHIGMTLDLYAHVLPAMDEEAADAFADLLDGPGGS